MSAPAAAAHTREEEEMFARVEPLVQRWGVAAIELVDELGAAFRLGLRQGYREGLADATRTWRQGHGDR